MLPQSLSTLTREIQIPRAAYFKTIKKNCPWKHEKTNLKRYHNWTNFFSVLPWAVHMAKNWKSISEIGLSNPLLYLLCGSILLQYRSEIGFVQVQKVLPWSKSWLFQLNFTFRTICKKFWFRLAVLQYPSILIFMHNLMKLFFYPGVKYWNRLKRFKLTCSVEDLQKFFLELGMEKKQYFAYRARRIVLSPLHIMELMVSLKRYKFENPFTTLYSVKYYFILDM